MRESGLIALLTIVTIAVVLTLIAPRDDQRVLSSAMERADTALRKFYPKPYLYDSLHYKSKYKVRKSHRILSLDLNSADSITLCKVYGIGAVFSSRIIKRRIALGGYDQVEQLREVRGIDQEVYGRIAEKFFIDRALIQKINVNFADREKLESHPYITPSMAKRIERERMKGGYITTHKELLERNILLPNEALRVTPYFSFDTIVKP